jgi:hypothetical protein
VCVFTLLLDHAWKLSGGNLGIEIGTTTKRGKKTKKTKRKKKGHLTQSLVALAKYFYYHT